MPKLLTIFRTDFILINPNHKEMIRVVIHQQEIPPAKLSGGVGN